jgi:NADH:ubiquinone oxidoreductase subunit 2 (subunit N)
MKSRITGFLLEPSNYSRILIFLIICFFFISTIYIWIDIWGHRHVDLGGILFFSFFIIEGISLLTLPITYIVMAIILMIDKSKIHEKTYFSKVYILLFLLNFLGFIILIRVLDLFGAD